MTTVDISCKSCEYDYWEIIAPAVPVERRSLPRLRYVRLEFFFLIAISRLFWLPPKTPDSPQSPNLAGAGGGDGMEERGEVLFCTFTMHT
ncbi:hypothetical protein E2C01_070963 [Portunus trituberculatus]|uniref:Uncharacterized protein n=1 Tax=Portunus trituberculatus TaxID=210409 RepID=A0A5B7I4Z9_PORTR|nr:hypothetical protein [Portunus trituberculatus]